MIVILGTQTEVNAGAQSYNFLLPFLWSEAVIGVPGIMPSIMGNDN
jgi:hypothetical protein